MKKIVVHVRKDGYEKVKEALEGVHYTEILLQDVYVFTIYAPDERQ